MDVDRIKSDSSWPKSVLLIIGNEFCERFSYYGMKAVLTLYFIRVLTFSDGNATQAFHVFAMACYFTPVIGAIIADSLLGKFRTIFYISIIYAVGNIALSYASYKEGLTLSIVGLVLVAFGTGGIKPCVAAFGGDQFGPGQERNLQRFFSFFYFAINAGSLLSMSVTPIFREDVSCSERGDCFPLAFGVPAALMVVALILFIIGKPFYHIIPAAKGNVVVQVASCSCYAFYRKIGSLFAAGKKDSWLDYAEDKFDLKLISDVKAVMRVLFMFLPLPIFWALFDQQGSSWVLQATRMSGNFFNLFTVKPDQIQVINPALILIMIPIFEYVVYPIFYKCHLLKNPLQKMAAGGILAAGSFVLAAFVEMRIQSAPMGLPTLATSHLTIINTAPCPIVLEANGFFTGSNDTTIIPGRSLNLANIDVTKFNGTKFVTKFANGTCNGVDVSPVQRMLNLEGETFLTLVVSLQETNLRTKMLTSHLLDRPSLNKIYVRVIYDLTKFPRPTNVTSFKLANKFNTQIFPMNGPAGEVGFTNLTAIPAMDKDTYELSLMDIGESLGKIDVEAGSIYDVIVEHVQQTNTSSIKAYRVLAFEKVNMFWQTFQYIVITSGEVMFSITGLEFSYSQAPASMKSVLQAAWLLTVAFGNLLVVIVERLHLFDQQSYEFLFFAALMALDMAVFAAMAWFYVYVEIPPIPDQSDHWSTPADGKTANGTSKGTDNDGYEEDTRF